MRKRKEREEEEENEKGKGSDIYVVLRQRYNPEHTQHIFPLNPTIAAVPVALSPGTLQGAVSCIIFPSNSRYIYLLTSIILFLDNNFTFPLNPTIAAVPVAMGPGTLQDAVPCIIYL